MAKFDRYMLSQLVLLFGFFALILVAIFWINRAVGLFDRLIGDGQTALVFLEFTALGLPKLISNAIPIASFAAAVYVTNRMTSESEMVVLQATGNSPWRLARPILFFGVCTIVLMSVLSHFLVPMAHAQLDHREREISQNVTSGLLREGQFLHPTNHVTFYTRAIDDDGVLRDVFLSDRRTPEEGVIYTAAEAYLINNEETPTLIMIDGLAQRLGTTDQRLATAKFRDFSFDISGLIQAETGSGPAVPHMTTPMLFRDWSLIARQSGTSLGMIAEEFHGRFSQPLFCLVAALVGFTTLLIGGYSRFGIWREITIAFALLVGLDGLRGTLIANVRSDAALWPLMYMPSVIGGAVALCMLLYLSGVGKGFRWRAIGRGAT